jgi:hypothetical protein
MDKQYLFVFGMSRSGTTALARVLTAHSKIVLGMERFKRMWRPERINKLGPHLFEKEAFFSFADGRTNITPEAGRQWAAYYRKAARNFDHATYIGDKITRPLMREFRANFPFAKFIIITREVYDVAYSWGVRAANPNDRWPAEHDARKAALVWNEWIAETEAARQTHPSDVLHVWYHRLFSDASGGELNRILAFLNLEIDPGTRRFFAHSHAQFASIVAPKERTLRDEDRAFVDAHAHILAAKALT